MWRRCGWAERLIESVNSRPDPAASGIKEADTTPGGPSDQSGKPRLLDWLAEFPQVVELKDRFVQTDSSSGGERAPFLEALGQSLLKRVGVIPKRFQPRASASIMQLQLSMKIHCPCQKREEQR